MVDNVKEYNIPRSIQQSNYRYTMPRIILKTQGQGGNIKTKFENIIEVSKKLYVPPDCIY